MIKYVDIHRYHPSDEIYKWLNDTVGVDYWTSEPIEVKPYTQKHERHINGISYIEHIHYTQYVNRISFVNDADITAFLLRWGSESDGLFHHQV